MERKNQPPAATATGTTPTVPSRLSESVKRVAARLDSPEHAARKQALDADQAARDREDEAADVRQFRLRLWRERGSRYEKCTLEHFITRNAAQRKVVAAMMDYAADLRGYVGGGRGLLLLGPSGTGKDHLVAALFNPAVDARLSVKWISGALLFSRLRERIDSTGESERKLLEEFTLPNILAISDPVPVGCELTGYQRVMLYQIVDARYNNRRPCWVTINASSGAEVDAKLGAPIVDRLRDGALSLACDWPSYRKSFSRE